MFSWGISLSQAKEIKKITLEEVLSIGDIEDDCLFQWVGVSVDSQGYIYVTDSMDYSVKKFDSKGRLIKKTGGKGQAPGEFLGIRDVESSEEFLYVTDQFLPGIQVFNNNLEYVRRIPLSTPVAELKVLSDQRIAISTLFPGEKPRIIILNEEGDVIREIVYSKKILPFMMDLVSFDIDSHGHIYIAFNFIDRIMKLDEKGGEVWSRSLLKKRKVKKEKISSYLVPTELVYKDISLDGEGNLFVLGGHLSKNRSRDVYVLSSEGKYLTSFSLPEQSHCLHVDRENFLYSRANDGITLKKFKMRYEYK